VALIYRRFVNWESTWMRSPYYIFELINPNAEIRPMRVSSSGSPRSLEFRSDGRQPGHYTRFGVTSGVAVTRSELSETKISRPATLDECIGDAILENPTGQPA
jgi:hypothetical protein